MGIEQKENGNYVSSHEPFKEHSYEWQAQNARNDSYRNSSATPETKSPPLTPLTSNTGGHSAPVAMPLLLSATKFYFFFIVAIWLVSIPAFRSMTIMTDAYGWVFPVSRFCVFILNTINSTFMFPVNALTEYLNSSGFSLFLWPFLYITLACGLLKKFWPKIKKVFLVFAIFYIGIGYVPIIQNWQLNTPGDVYIMQCNAKYTC